MHRRRFRFAGTPLSAVLYMTLRSTVLFSPIFLSTIVLSTRADAAAAKTYLITFGKTMPVKWFSANADTQPRTMKVRPLLVDVHEVTERLGVVQRAFRLSDSLPEDSGAPRWQWQRGGWLLVDRIHLAEFGSTDSGASWYRDLCGVLRSVQRRQEDFGGGRTTQPPQTCAQENSGREHP
jgi:hypothetical protein